MKSKVKTEIVKVKGDWQEVVNDCRATVGKAELGKEPSVAFKKSVLIAEHSPIRGLAIKWRWQDIKSWIATHWSRHKWECFIQTQREDRTGIPRDCQIQSAPVSFTGEANAQSLIDTMRKRLCHQAAEETRLYAEDLKLEIGKIQPELAGVLVPNCIYRGGCPEMQTCGLYHAYKRWCFKNYQMEAGCVCIAKRYDMYNEWFIAKRRTEHGVNPLEEA